MERSIWMEDPAWKIVHINDDAITWQLFHSYSIIHWGKQIQYLAVTLVIRGEQQQ
jgi:hypothetical protein